MVTETYGGGLAGRRGGRGRGARVGVLDEFGQPPSSPVLLAEQGVGAWVTLGVSLSSLSVTRSLGQAMTET